MKKILFAFLICGSAFAGDCGPGYVLVDVGKIDGVVAKECRKLWCRDLETGRVMGNKDRAANGYFMTAAPVELCDVNGNCIECFGDRKWCSGAAKGIWNPEYGAYTRAGADSATYTSVQKGGCFNWNLEKPVCPEGEDAILQNDEWVCAVPQAGSGSVGRASAVRRTGTRLRGVFRR
ncbi:MAG: hypothetical protein J6Y07_03365 [Alphaproteobacteria bacterium]|nr:hypothetical protein [Alphaproteobacteria bacterium]